MSNYIQLIYRDVYTYPCPNPDADLVNLSMYKGPLINKMFESIAIQSRPEKNRDHRPCSASNDARPSIWSL